MRIVEAKQSTSLEKQHFVFLDGLRGVAALAVALLHASLIFKLRLRPAHAYLAVDFFFCLSGFVVAYAYDDRLRSVMNASQFLKRRLIRLYPMIFIGVILGYFSTIAILGMQGRFNLADDTLLLFAALVMLPLGVLFHHQAFPLNNPLWSLFFELIANFVYAIHQHFSRSSIFALKTALIFAAAILILVAWHFKTVQTMGFSNSLTFLGGFVRTFYPFLAGIVIYRFSLFNHGVPMPPLLIGAALIAVMFLPIATDTTWLYDCVAIIVLFPAIVIFGAATTDNLYVSGFWKLLGKLSYPFYVVHLPVLKTVFLVCVYAKVIQTMPYLSASLGLIAAVSVSYLCLRFYDEPTREWLSNHGKRRRLQVPQGDVKDFHST
jgi:peptidoglycan/LPS O-acetylase OafA/YrhL